MNNKDKFMMMYYACNSNIKYVSTGTQSHKMVMSPEEFHAKAMDAYNRWIESTK